MKYKVIIGISYDVTGEQYRPGDTADLSKWPQDIINRWVQRGVIAPVEEQVKRAKNRKMDKGLG